MNKYIPIRSKNSTVSFLIDKKAVRVILILAVLVCAVFVINTGMGEMKITPWAVLKVFFGYGTEMDGLVIHQFRLPRIIVALLVGASLAVAGAILQGIVKNPLSSPDLIGITGGAGAAVSIFFVLFTNPIDNSLTVSIRLLPIAAFAGATLVAFLLYVLAWKNGVSPIRLVLIGIGLHTAMQAITTTMIILGPVYLITQVTIWLTGSVYGSSWEDVWILLPWVLVLLLVAMILTRNLNVQELGDEVAIGVGSDVQRQRFILLLVCTALVGGAVAFGGAVGFVGLLAPHIARRLVGSAFGGLLPASALIGGIMVMTADLIGRTAFAPHDIPAGVFTAVIGAPYFVYLLYRNRHV